MNETPVNKGVRGRDARPPYKRCPFKRRGSAIQNKVGLFGRESAIQGVKPNLLSRSGVRGRVILDIVAATKGLDKIT